MTTLTIKWRPVAASETKHPMVQTVLALLEICPIRVDWNTTSTVIVPGEPFSVTSGEAISITIELPRLKTIHQRHSIPVNGRKTLSLDTDGLLRDLADHGILADDSFGLLPRTSGGDLPPYQYKIKSVNVDIHVGLRRLAPIAASLFPRSAALAGGKSAVTVSGSRPVSLSAKVASRKSLPRIMMIPYAGTKANECRIVTVTPVGASPRLRVEPADPVATLLMDYLIAGNFVLACAAARAIEKRRADRNPSEWAKPSYCQLLIGYSYALGRDIDRLYRWCHRTDAKDSLGTDGLILAAEAARLQLNNVRSANLIGRAAGAPPPLLAHGVNIGLRIASVLLAECDQPVPDSSSWAPSASQAARLRQIRKELSRLLFVADAESSSLSIPTAKDPKAILDVSRFRTAIRRTSNWLAVSRRSRYLVTNEHQTRKHQFLIGEAMAGTSGTVHSGSDQSNGQDSGQSKQTAASGVSGSPQKLSGPALWVAIFALLVWLAFSIVLLFNISKSDTDWTRITWIFGSIQSVAFAAAGALFGTAVQQQNVNNAQQQAASAKQTADQLRDSAANGRALAAAVQSDDITKSADGGDGLTPMGPGEADTADSAEAVRRRHAQISRSLFGNVLYQEQP